MIVNLKKAMIVALAALTAVFCACVPARTSDGEPAVTPAPRVRYSTTHYIRYWPEDADYASCDCYCVVEAPYFDGTYTAAYAMNRAVSDYIEELAARVENEYLPKASAEKPGTEVTVGVEYIPGCTNVIFTEEHSYLGTAVKRTHVLMLDDRGNEMNLCDIFLDYHTAERAAELAAQRLGCDKADVLAAVDINHGAKATLAGCTVFVNYNGAETPVDLTFSDLSPSSRFDALSLNEFRAVTELLRFVSDAAVVRQENISDGVLSAFEASSFMGEYARTLGVRPYAGRISIPQNGFEKYYRSIFGQEFPGIDADGHDIRLEDGVYSVLDLAKPYEYHVDMLDVTAEGDELTVTGDLIFGAFGYAYTEYVCHVSAVLVRSAESPFGFMLKSYIMSV